ncbi:MAG: hypothetical protein U1F68_04280 [Gammaproteobacteria bacterium]
MIINSAMIRWGPEQRVGLKARVLKKAKAAFCLLLLFVLFEYGGVGQPLRVEFIGRQIKVARRHSQRQRTSGLLAGCGRIPASAAREALAAPCLRNEQHL